MQDLWGNEITQPITPPKPAAQQPQPPPRRKTASLECAYYGHSWQRIGLSDEKQCIVCSIKGYCPGCTPVPPQNAQPFFCTKHTPQAERMVEA